MASITVVGAGILGLWQALTLLRAGHRVRLVERSAEPFTRSASRFAGAMLAPFCEAESAPPVVQKLGIEALEIWRRTYPDIVWNGTLVLAQPRDRAELARFARLTEGHAHADADRIAALEPALTGRFAAGLLYPAEAHFEPGAAMRFLLGAAIGLGLEARFGEVWSGDRGGSDYIIDCRGLAAAGDIPALRGVRGERVLLRSGEIALRRMVRMLHPRTPVYIVPWGDGRFMVGATVIESDDDGPVTVRSALELLGMAYALHPAFAEAEVIDLGAGVRPALPDNVPKIIVDGRRIHVNGAYRHGFLLAPVLAEAVAAHLADGAMGGGLIEGRSSLS